MRLGFYKTLFTAPSSSTSSEISEQEQNIMGLSPGMVRISVGLDNDIERTFDKIRVCISDLNSLISIPPKKLENKVPNQQHPLHHLLQILLDDSL